MSILEFLKVLLFGLVEGYTEFLPISSTGHLILLDSMIHLEQPEEFFAVFKVVIQLGAILAVVVLYWDRLWPFGRRKTKKEMTEILLLWCKIALACVPAAVIGFFLDDLVDAKLSTPLVVGSTLIFYGIAFLLLERFQKGKEFPIRSTGSFSWRLAFFIGLFQCLSFVPGTSRSGATILGGMLLGVSRAAAAEFSFYLGIPVMAGASFLKLVKSGLNFTGTQWLMMLLGTAASFGMALLAVRYLTSYLKKHDFTVFGWYRIVLGVLVLLQCQWMGSL